MPDKLNYVCLVLTYLPTFVRNASLSQRASLGNILFSVLIVKDVLKEAWNILGREIVWDIDNQQYSRCTKIPGRSAMFFFADEKKTGKTICLFISSSAQLVGLNNNPKICNYKSVKISYRTNLPVFFIIPLFYGAKNLKESRY